MIKNILSPIFIFLSIFSLIVIFIGFIILCLMFGVNEPFDGRAWIALTFMGGLPVAAYLYCYFHILKKGDKK